MVDLQFIEHRMFSLYVLLCDLVSDILRYTFLKKKKEKETQVCQILHRLGK